MTHREIDALVAEKVMGFKKIQSEPDLYDGPDWNYSLHPETDLNSCNGPLPIPSYSTSIEAAWEVVSKLEDEFEIRIFGPHPRLSDEDWDQWECEFTNKTTRAWYSGVGETTCEAICLAALKTVGIRTLIDF